ncbi:MAG: hypothetical protein AB9866_17900 [Syntrophobacteraceae bacterium]
MSENRRKYKRYKGKEGAFAAFIRPNEFINLGKIQDISLNGLCVRYLATKGVSTEYSGIKIFGSNGRFIHVERVQCKIIYDYEIPEGSWEQLSTRQCGVQFENLSVRSLSMLQDFIENFTHCEFHLRSNGRLDFPDLLELPL